MLMIRKFSIINKIDILYRVESPFPYKKTQEFVTIGKGKKILVNFDIFLKLWEWRQRRRGIQSFTIY